jgi:hypothetical protein
MPEYFTCRRLISFSITEAPDAATGVGVAATKTFDRAPLGCASRREGVVQNATRHAPPE